MVALLKPQPKHLDVVPGVALVCPCTDSVCISSAQSQTQLQGVQVFLPPLIIWSCCALNREDGSKGNRDGGGSCGRFTSLRKQQEAHHRHHCPCSAATTAGPVPQKPRLSLQCASILKHLRPLVLERDSPTVGGKDRPG